MSQETQLVRPGGYSPGAEDPWYQPQALAPAAPGGAPQSQPLKRLHRLLRGRYLLACVLAVGGAAAGAVAAYFLKEPLFRSNGLIEIEPVYTNYMMQEKVVLMYENYVRSQATMLQSERVVNDAMGSEEWKNLSRGSGTDELRQFIESLEINYIPNSNLIRVSFTDPDAKAAPQAVKAVINAYLKIYGDVDSAKMRQNAQLLENKKTQLSNTLRGKREMLLSAAREYGTQKLDAYHDAKLQELVRLESQLTQAQMHLAAAEAAVGKEETTREELTITQIAAMDPTMRQYLQQRQQAEDNLARLRRTLGDNHRNVVNVQLELELLESRIESHAVEFRRNHVGGMINPDGMGTVPLNEAGVNQLRARVQILQSQFQREKDSTAAIGRKQLDIQTLQMEIDELRANYDEVVKRIDQLNMEASMRGQLKVISFGDKPVAPISDKRQQLAVLGFIVGGGLPVTLLLLVGLLDPRYRYSDDAGSDMSGIPLLGILPNLPDLLHDPEQAAVAAHCVHQIRTMLQVAAESHDRHTFAVTSPSPGDGKTSLTLALGLSFAASGSRTLLIDCDLVGGGLSARMNVRKPEGVLEALAQRSLMPYVQPAEVTDLSILPIGGAHGHHASMLSPAGLRRLVTEARKHFDVVLIDTGPILGSIEATAVAVAADAVVLTVACGQQRPLVEKSLNHLMNIGARLAGVVFNRAQARDFEQSVSRFSTRVSRRLEAGPDGPQAGNGSPPNRVEPVASAVVGSYDPGNGTGQG